MEEIQTALAGWYDSATAGPSPQHAGCYAPLITGKVCGVGAHLGLVNPPSGKTAIVVVDMEQHAPAERAGVRLGDVVVVAVDGRPVRGRLYIPDDVSAMIRGQEGTTVELVVERSGGELVRYKLVRERLDVEAADVGGDAGNSLFLTEHPPSPVWSPRKESVVPVTP